MRAASSRTLAFEPDDIRAMHRAFDALCTKLQLSTTREMG